MDRHEGSVNIVRWSPNGLLLASGGDDKVIILWQKRENEMGGGVLFGDETGVGNAEKWVVYKMLRFHVATVTDLSWSPCSQLLLSGSVDNTAIISNVHKNEEVSRLTETKNDVQGVAWNPKLPLLATHSSDRACRVYNSTTKKMIAVIPKKAEAAMFHDDNSRGLSRRLCWSPDGELLLTPYGVESDTNSKISHCTWPNPQHVVKLLSSPSAHCPIFSSLF